jgi:hypothetical protein
VVIDVDPTSNGGYIIPIAKTKLPNGIFSIPTSLTMDKDPNLTIPSLTQKETKTKKAKLSSKRNMSSQGIPTAARTFRALHMAIAKTSGQQTASSTYLPPQSLMRRHTIIYQAQSVNKPRKRWQNLQLNAILP